MSVVYFSQEDSRWRNVLYTITGNKTQTIGTSACGPTCMAMVISSLTGKTVLPTTTANYAVESGYRTANSGTSWGYYKDIASKYGLFCEETTSLDVAKSALREGKLVIASMRPGHFTGGGHYILLVGIQDKDGTTWINVHDPNMDNKKYGSDGLINQGTRDDGKVTAKEIVFKNEAKRYWIFDVAKKSSDKSETMEEDKMTVSEKKEFDELKAQVESLVKKSSMDIPNYAKDAIDALTKMKDKDGKSVVDTPNGRSADFYAMATVLHRVGLFDK